MLLEKLFRKTPSPPASNKDMFVFAIGFIGSHLTDDFDFVCRLLGKTVQSCLGQRDGNFRILIACNEIPGAHLVPKDSRIDYLVLDRISKAELAEKPRHDFSVKRHTLMKATAGIQARYFFQLDADDLVSNRLVERVRKADNPNGCLVEQGYMLDCRTNQLYPVPNSRYPRPTFDSLCGSSIIVSLIPGAAEEAKNKNLEYLAKIWRQGHGAARANFQTEGRPAHILDFPAVIYRANHGANLYLRLNPGERTSFIDEFASMCPAVEGAQLEAVRQEFSFFE